MKKLNTAEDYEPVMIQLDPIKTPKAYYNRVYDLLTDGYSREEAEKLALEPIECEIYYEVGAGLFAVESEAVEFGDIYSPYTMEKYLES